MNDMTRVPGAARLEVKTDAPVWFRDAIARPRTSHLVPVAGCDVHYLKWAADRESENAGVSGALFVHGGGAHANWWSFIAPFFTDRGPVAAMDLSGMGDSGRRETYSAAVRATEIRDVLADAGLGPRPVVVGHSFGGYMTMKFGREFGDRVAGAGVGQAVVRAGQRVDRDDAISRGGEHALGGLQAQQGRAHLVVDAVLLLEDIARLHQRGLQATQCGLGVVQDVRVGAAEHVDERVGVR